MVTMSEFSWFLTYYVNDHVPVYGQAITWFLEKFRIMGGTRAF